MWKKFRLPILVLVFSLFVLLSACANTPGQNAADIPADQTDNERLFQTDDSVTLTQSSIVWETYQYALTDFNTILDGSYDGVTKTEVEFDTWVLENRYLKVTLLPEYGGRILSIFYKPTGHEELYQNPVGVPYQIGTNVFYHDWLMVYGGIFPTFPEPEHGKYWLLPWEFEIIQDNEQEVVVSMSRVDDLENPFAPAQYNLGATGLKVTYTIGLKAGRAALDTQVLIENPGAETAAYEYWTNATFAPGSAPGDPKTTSGAEIIAPVEMVKIPGYWQGIAAQEKPAGLMEVYDFQNLRSFENWADMGIAYAFPDIKSSNFWGVINHDNQEGIFRVADNSFTPGMKIWTWGYPQTAGLDPHQTDNEARPYIELWAGVTREFWQRTALDANQQVEFWEVYSPSVGLNSVTHADPNFLVNCGLGEAGSVDCQVFGMYPDQQVTATLLLDEAKIYTEAFMLNPEKGNAFSAALPALDTAAEGLRLIISDMSGNDLFAETVLLTTHE